LGKLIERNSFISIPFGSRATKWGVYICDDRKKKRRAVFRPRARMSDNPSSHRNGLSESELGEPTSKKNLPPPNSKSQKMKSRPQRLPGNREKKKKEELFNEYPEKGTGQQGRLSPRPELKKKEQGKRSNSGKKKKKRKTPIQRNRLQRGGNPGRLSTTEKSKEREYWGARAVTAIRRVRRGRQENAWRLGGGNGGNSEGESAGSSSVYQSGLLD